jgi:hypothetical protein
MTAQDILNAAAAALPGSWSRGSVARNDIGGRESPTSPKAVAWCAVAHIERAAAGRDANPAISLLAGRISEQHERPRQAIANWVDRPGQTEGAIVAAMRGGDVESGGPQHGAPDTR